MSDHAASETTPPAPARLVDRLRALLPWFSRPRSLWALVLLTALVGAATEPLIPALLQPLLDRGFSAGALPLWQIPAALIGLFAIRGLAQFVSQVGLARIANDGMLDLRKALFDRLLQAEPGLFSRQSASALSNTVVYEVQTGALLLVQALLAVFRDGFTLLALLAYLLFLNWKLTLIVGVTVPGVAWIMKVFSRRLYHLTRDSQAATDELAYVVEENVLAHRVVRLHGAQTGQAGRFGQLSQQLRRLAVRATMASAATTPLTQLLAAVALSAVIAIALWQSQSGGHDAVTVGGFVAFITAMLMLIAPIRRLADVAGPITRGVAALERGLRLLDEVPVETSGSRPLGRCRGEIEWQKAQLRFADGVCALDQVDLQVGAGEVIAFVGPSGAGKTTLVNLLPRFVAASAGRILLDGVDIRDYRLTDLRRQFAMVSQDVVMLNDTLAANVALGEIPDRERITRCLRAAHLADHVDGLPQGMDTRLGHNAAQLSGGQRQRLAIARALYKDAPILILDEATSALDGESERAVQAALAHLMQGRTTLIVAHRLSTIEHADRVVVMNRGRVVEQGTHAALLEQGGLYARLHRAADPSGALPDTA